MTKGNKRSWPFGVRANCLKAKLTPARDLSMMFSGYPFALRSCLNFKGLNHMFFRRVSCKQSYCFAFDETIFYAWWVARGEHLGEKAFTGQIRNGKGRSGCGRGGTRSSMDFLTSLMFRGAFIQINPPIYTVSRWKDATISSSFSPKGCSRFFIRRFTIEVAVSLKMIFFLSHRYIVGTYQDEHWKTWAPRRPSSRQNNTNENSVT